MTGSLREKNNKYFLRISFKNERGEWRQKQVATGIEVRGGKKKAQQFLENYLAKNFDEDLQQGNKFLFKDYLGSWLNSKRGNVENNTFLEYQGLLNNHIIPYFLPMKLSIKDIKPKHIADFYEFKSKNGRADGKTGGVSSKLLKHFRTVFCQVFKKAIIEEIIENHPSMNVPIPKLIKTEKVSKFLESTEVQDVINAFEGHILKPVVIIAIYYGLRRSEILGLKWNAINFEKNTLEIKHTVLCHSEGIEKRDRTKTSSSRRTLGLISEIKDLFINLKNQQNENETLFGKKYEKSDYVFTWQDGKLLRPDYITKVFQKILKKHDLKNMRFHDLRHSCASLLYEKGFGVKDIQKWLGHSDIKTTSDIYTHISNLHMETLAKSLSGCFKLSAS